MEYPINYTHLDKNNTINIRVFESQELKYPLHFHSSDYELTLTLGSKGMRLVGDNIAEFEDSDLVLIGPGLPHCWFNSFLVGTDTPETVMVIVIHFNDHLIGKDTLERKEFQKIRDLLKKSSRGICFKGEIKSKIASEVMKLKIEPDFKTIIELLTILNELGEVKDHSYLTGESYSYKGKDSESSSFENVFHYILQHFREKVKISEAARLINMNDSAFSHYFKKRTLKSFTDYLNELRLTFAANMLSSTKESVAEICFKSGFNNLSNFNRMFKKWKGETPLHYRKNSKK